ATVAVAWRSRLQSDDVPPPVLPARVEVVAPPPAPPEPLPPLREQPPGFELAYAVQTVSGAERWAPGLLLGAQAPIGRGYNLSFSLPVPAPRAAQDPPAFGSKTWRWMEVGLVVGPSYRSTTENLYIDALMGLGEGVNITTSESLRAADSYRLVPPSLV